MITGEELSKALVVLQMNPYGCEVDAAYDVHKRIEPSDKDVLPVLHKAISDHDPFVQSFGMNGILRLGGDISALMPRIYELAFAASDHYVKWRALRLISKYVHVDTDHATRALYSIAKDGKAYCGERLYALLILLKSRYCLVRKGDAPSKNSLKKAEGEGLPS